MFDNEYLYRVSDSLETSPQIIRAIEDISADFQATWEAPTKSEIEDIIAIVTQDGRYQTTDFVWGAAGTDWAS